MSRETGSGSTGVVFALGAYGLWGLIPAYWKAVDAIPAAELVGHRIVWSFALGVALVTATRSWPKLLAVLRSRSQLAPIAAAAVLISANWLVYLYAIETDRILATSLGYYINPLLNVLLGMAFLGERLRPAQIAAVAFAAGGVAYLTIDAGALPWISVALPLSFGLYGLVRKTAPVEPLVGFGVEMSLLAPAAGLYLFWLSRGGALAFPEQSGDVRALVACAGVMTAAPLILFNSAARRLRLVTLGFFQFLAPSLAFVLAVALYGEPFTRSYAIAFGCVWSGLLIYSADSLRARGWSAGSPRPGSAGLPSALPPESDSARRRP